MKKQNTIKPRTRFTRAYYKTLVKDNGFHEVLRKLRKKYGLGNVDADTPATADRVGEAYNREITLTFWDKNLKRPKIVKTFFTSSDGCWKFFNQDGEPVKIWNIWED